jgi:hypothetical protein
MQKMNLEFSFAAPAALDVVISKSPRSVAKSNSTRGYPLLQLPLQRAGSLRFKKGVEK